MRAFYQDVRFGLRLLRSNPGFAVLAVLTLALGIAANTTVFGWIDGLLLHPFAGASDSHRLAVLEMSIAGAPNGSNQISYLDYRDYRDHMKSISGLAVDHSWDVVAIGDADHAQPVLGQLVSGNYFAVLGVKPALGRVFTPDEDGDKLGAYPVAVISHRLWWQRFHGNPGVIGKTLRVNRRELTIVGVAPAEFRGTFPALAFDIWVPVTMGRELGILDEWTFRERGNRCLYPVARLKPGITIGQAGAEAATFARSLVAAFPNTNRGVSATILPVWESRSGAGAMLLKPLRILMVISVIVLLIACTNVANLLLARSVARRKELGIRLALGASPGRLLRQLLTETLVLAGAGALAGLPLASWMADWLPSLLPRVGLSIVSGFQLNGRVLGFTVLICVVSAVVSGLAPALFWRRSDVNETLKEGGRSGTSGTRSHRTRGLLVISEVALATVALIGAGLFVRSFENARTIHPGFDRNNVVLVRSYMGGTGYSTVQIQQFCVRLRERLRSAPGISKVNYADFAPLGAGAGPWEPIQVEGYVPGQGEPMKINRGLVAPGYFSLLRIPLLDGRDFTESDDSSTMPVMIVNESFARRYFDGRNPIGRRVWCWGKWITVVGLARDSKYFDIAEPPVPYFYAPFRQQYEGSQELFFFIKVVGDPAPVIAGLRHEITGIDPNAGAFHSMLLTAWTEITLLPQKMAANLLAVLGLISLLLAGVGLYSVMAYAVTQRTQELGIRMALGAQRRDVLGDVLRRGMALTIAGLAAGIAAALAITRLVASMLVNVSAADPMTFAGAALFLASVALLASYLPARRATKVDPMVALRCQ